MRIFKTPVFAKWARQEKLTDGQLRQAVKEMEQGLIEADLGGHIYKKRVALPSFLVSLKARKKLLPVKN